MGKFLATLLLLASLPAVAQELVLKLASAPPRPGVISTRGVDAIELRVLSGHSVSIARSSGRDYQLQAGGGFFWTQVQEVPMNLESVALTPTLEADGSVTVTMAVVRKEGTETLRYSSTVVAQAGEWVQLFGPPPNRSRSTRVYGTQQVSDDALFLRIEY